MVEIWQIVSVSLLWALVSMAVTLVVAIPLALLLARKEFPWKTVVSATFSLPMVLPPTAVGFVLLQLLSANGWIGVDWGILLTWRAIIVACAVMSFPLVVRTIRVSFEEVDHQLEWVAYSLGRSTWNVFWTVTFPLASKGILAGAILGFTRALGEFGATITIAGNIPGRTQTLSAAIYSAQQSGNEERATLLLMVAVAVGFSAVFLTEWLTHGKQRGEKRRPHE